MVDEDIRWLRVCRIVPWVIEATPTDGVDYCTGKKQIGYGRGAYGGGKQPISTACFEPAETVEYEAIETRVAISSRPESEFDTLTH